MKRLVSRFGMCFLSVLLWSCESKPTENEAQKVMEQPGLVQLSFDEIQAGWQLLFNGVDISGWRGYNQDTLPACWAVEDGHLVCRQEAEGRGDLITRDKYEDFELVMEVMYYDSANSGVFHRVQELPDQPMWASAPEYQLLDNSAYQSMFGEKFPSHGVGECYEMYEAESDYSHPLGEWNKVKIISLGSHVEYWLNGYRTVSFEIGTPDWESRVAKSKFKPHQQQFGKIVMGHIGLQDHGHNIRFKNIKIRKIDNQ